MLEQMNHLAGCIRLNDEEKADLRILLSVWHHAKVLVDLHPELESPSATVLRQVFAMESSDARAKKLADELTGASK